jgi:hypothetical protein
VDSGARVDARLHRAVVGDRALRHLDHEERAPRVLLRGLVRGEGSGDRDVGLRLAVDEGQGKLGPDAVAAGQRLHEGPAEPLEHGRVAGLRGRGLDDHPLDELDVLVLLDDAHLEQPVVLVDGEAARER